MSSPEMNSPLPPELALLEAALSGLRLPESRCDRDRVLFLAGQAAGPRPTGTNHTWKVATGTAIAAAVLLACGCWCLWRQNQSLQTIVEAKFERAPAPQQMVSPPDISVPVLVQAEPVEPGFQSSSLETAPLAPANTLRLRELLLKFGTDVIPLETASAGGESRSPVPPRTYESFREEFQLKPRADSSEVRFSFPGNWFPGDKS